MQLLQTSGWHDYELLDSGDGERLERFGEVILIRPDPQLIWKPKYAKKVWKERADVYFERISAEKGKWVPLKKIPQKWLIHFENIAIICKLSPFKHTGIFPEQSLHWQWIKEKIASSNYSVNVLNLFGYTGIASLVAASVGAKVTHIDASYPTIGWARENQQASQLTEKPIRWILDDAIKFVSREVKRGVKYNAVIMDPPVYGHGPKGEKWSFNESFPHLLELCKQVISEEPLFVISNAYAISSSSIMLNNFFEDTFSTFGGTIEYGELALEEKDRGRLLSTGLFARWSK